MTLTATQLDQRMESGLGERRHEPIYASDQLRETEWAEPIHIPPTPEPPRNSIHDAATRTLRALARAMLHAAFTIGALGLCFIANYLSAEILDSLSDVPELKYPTFFVIYAVFLAIGGLLIWNIASQP